MKSLSDFWFHGRLIKNIHVVMLWVDWQQVDGVGGALIHRDGLQLCCTIHIFIDTAISHYRSHYYGHLSPTISISLAMIVESLTGSSFQICSYLIGKCVEMSVSQRQGGDFPQVILRARTFTGCPDNNSQHEHKQDKQAVDLIKQFNLCSTSAFLKLHNPTYSSL